MTRGLLTTSNSPSLNPHSHSTLHTTLLGTRGLGCRRCDDGYVLWVTPLSHTLFPYRDRLSLHPRSSLVYRIQSNSWFLSYSASYRHHIPSYTHRARQPKKLLLCICLRCSTSLCLCSHQVNSRFASRISRISRLICYFLRTIIPVLAFSYSHALLADPILQVACYLEQGVSFWTLREEPKNSAGLKLGTLVCGARAGTPHPMSKTIHLCHFFHTRTLSHDTCIYWRTTTNT